MSGEVEGGRLEGSFEYELLLAIREARKLYINSRVDPSLIPTFYDSVISICDLIEPFLTKEERMELKPRITYRDVEMAEPLVKNQILRRRIRSEAHRLFKKVIELCAGRGLITVPGRGL